jgi:hypothetical protein
LLTIGARLPLGTNGMFSFEMLTKISKIAAEKCLRYYLRIAWAAETLTFDNQGVYRAGKYTLINH